MGAVETVIDAATDNRTYYNCPRCGQRVWAYGSYVGNVCWNCPGTITSGLISTVDAVHPVGAVTTPIKKNKLQIDAKAHGTCKFWITPDGKSDKLTGNEESDYIKQYTTRSCRILHGSVSWLATAAKNVYTDIDDAIEHWWLTIETKNGVFYVLQFRGASSSIEMNKCSSSYQCDQTGLHEAAKKENATIWTEWDYSERFNKDRYTIGDVRKWLESKKFSPKYHLLNNNCQDLCRAFYRKF